MGVFTRTAQRGPRRLRRGRHSVADLVAMAKIPERFRAATALYLETYATRITPLYASQRCKASALGYFWRFMSDRYPEVASSADVLPAHARAYVPYVIAQAREGQPQDDRGETSVRTMAHSRLVHLRTYFADICTWASEPGSPLRGSSASHHTTDSARSGGGRIRQGTQTGSKAHGGHGARSGREMPNIRAFAFRKWYEAERALKTNKNDPRLREPQKKTCSGTGVSSSCWCKAAFGLRRRVN